MILALLNAFTCGLGTILSVECAREGLKGRALFFGILAAINGLCAIYGVMTQ